MSNVETHTELHGLFNDRDYSGIQKRSAESFTYTDHARNITLTTAEEFLGWLRDWVTSLDGGVTGARYIDAGDTSIARFIGRGTNVGPIGQLPATERKAAFDLCELLTFDADGLVTGGDIYYDQLGLLAQLGHVEPPTG